MEIPEVSSVSLGYRQAPSPASCEWANFCRHILQLESRLISMLLESCVRLLFTIVRNWAKYSTGSRPVLHSNKRFHFRWSPPPSSRSNRSFHSGLSNPSSSIPRPAIRSLSYRTLRLWLICKRCIRQRLRCSRPKSMPHCVEPELLRYRRESRLQATRSHRS